MVIVTISGAPRSGKSTLGRLLAAKLGVPFFSMGDMRREYARRQGITLEELNKRAITDPTSDKFVDEFQSRLDEEYPRGFVVDSRLGYYFLPQSVKICILVTPEVAAARAHEAKRDVERWKSVPEAVSSLTAWWEADRARFMALYSTDPEEKANFDLVLDSSHAEPEALLERVLAYLRERGIVHE